MDLRKLIVEWIKANGVSPIWLLDVYYYLRGQGVSTDDAIKALQLFVDEVVAMKAKKKEPVI